MSNSSSLNGISVMSLTAVLAISAGGVTQVSAQAPQDAGRAMTFLDVQKFSSPGAWAPSPDGRWMLYTITTPNWQEDDRQSDIHLVSMEDGVSSSRQLTFTDEKNEISPTWSRDGSFFVFASNRDAEVVGDAETDEDVNQLYLMRPGGGEAQRITDAEEGVRDFGLSDDGRSLVYRGGAEGREQLYRLPVDGILSS